MPRQTRVMPAQSRVMPAQSRVMLADFGYEARADPFRFELTAPSGTLWTFGPAGAAQVYRGSPGSGRAPGRFARR